MKGKPIKTLCALVSTFFLGLSVSCGRVPDNVGGERISLETESYQKTTIKQLKENADYNRKFVEVKGYPISVSESLSNHGGGILYVMLKDGKDFLLASTINKNVPFNKMAVIIKSEINDGDNESITLKGLYNNGDFRIICVEANGYSAKYE